MRAWEPAATLVLMDTAWSLEPWLDLDWLAGSIASLKIAFWALLGLFILLALPGGGRGQQRPALGKAYRAFCWLLALLFAGVLVYQATWQLAGFARPEFVQFMKRYNRRPDNPAARMVRGTILDAQGLPLALSDPAAPDQRRYPEGPAFCHLVGYAHPWYGLSGIEAAEHATLSGVTRDTGPEWERFRRNLIQRDELRGHDVALTVSAALQREAHELMKGHSGAVVVLDPARGDVLVLYSSPGYDPNQLGAEPFARADPRARLFNRALQGLYPPGSTFKVLIAAAALERGLNPWLDCPADGFQVGPGDQFIRDHEYYDYQRRGRVWPGHGTLSMRDALAESSNVYFARLGNLVGGELLQAMAERTALTRPWILHQGSSGRLTAVAGRFPTLSNRDLAKTAQISIGQGELLVTPFYLAVLAGAIGREGVVVPPRITAAPAVGEPFRMLSPETARAVAGLMRHVVTDGTGRAADLAGLDVAGKTGTAQNPHGAAHGWFMGFAPAIQPRLAFAVVVEQGGYGSQSALPIAVGLLRKTHALGGFNVPRPSPGGS